MSDNTEVAEHIFSADRPIKGEAEDLLDRAHFQKSFQNHYCHGRKKRVLLLEYMVSGVMEKLP